ncbi:hypothetical protein HD806DRAFT_540296 [Xylariaceae sp. AK1471]|nr:hypothetical protein HD806DRAFT_540296 [Xylariaceae sp. AK1471]
MHHASVLRRVIFLAIVAFLVVASLTYQYSLGSRSTQFIKFTTTDPTKCKVWPDPRESDLEVYEKCQGTIHTPHIGHTSVLGNPRKCIPANTRLGQYRSSTSRNWTEVKWGRVQSHCASERHELSPYENHVHQRWRLHPNVSNEENISGNGEGKIAVVLRTWDDYEYTDNRLAWLRALIAEVSLQRNDKYRVFFLVNVKDPEVRLEEDGTAYDEVMHKCVPREFRDMALLFNERTLKAWYPQIPEHGAQDQMYQALQIFSHRFPQYEYIWQLEMDLRFTSHAHDTLQSASAFARAQSRHNLWERNGRFYIPTLHNDSYETFISTVDVEIGDTGVWGPVSTLDFEPQGPQPPPRAKQYWGIGEEADLISFMPMIDPVGTDWVYENGIHGFAEKEAAPRRVAIVSCTRSSRRLLHLVSEAQRQRGQWLVSEATLETFALLHGLKAVTVPHPIAFHNDMTMEELDANINKGPPSNKAGGELPSLLYTNKGWIDGPWPEASYWFTGNGAQHMWDAYIRGDQLPPMLLHPVKEK